MSDDVRTRIVDAAVRLLETKGAKGFGQVQVAREAGLQQGHLTYYFPHKRDLVTAVIARISERAREDLTRAVELRGAVDAEASEAMLFGLIRTLLRDRKRSKVILAMVAEAGEDPDVRGALADLIAEQRRILALFLGRAPDDPDVRIAAAALRGLGLEHLVESDDDDAEIDAIVDRFRAWFAGRPGTA